MAEKNRFDNLEVDVAALWHSMPIGQAGAKKKPGWMNSPFHFLYSLEVMPLRWREYLWHLFRRTNLDQAWFEEFGRYWSKALGGRPLWGVQDFYFLRSWYRLKFQASDVPDTTNANIHLQAWQRPEVLYQLLHLVYKESIITELAVLRLLEKFRPEYTRLLEFGSATAPITTTLFEFFPATSDLKVYVTDIETLAFHYAAYKFRDVKAVTAFPLLATDDFLLTLPEPVDAIFCLTVFEHLNKPLETIKRFQQYLKPGGLLIFDYLKGEGEGLDTHHAVRERQAVLAYIQNNFDLLQGSINSDDNVSLAVVRCRA
jgi:SAM-dependent methyltransferase